MARSHYRGTIYGDQAAGVKPLSGAAVRLYDPLTGNPWPYPVYPDPVNGAAYTSPILTDAVGTLDLWADDPARVAVTITHPSYRGSGGVIDIEPDPAESATDEDVSESVAEHEAKENPHPQYLTQDEADLAYLKLSGGTVTGDVRVTGKVMGGVASTLALASDVNVSMDTTPGGFFYPNTVTSLGHPAIPWEGVHANGGTFGSSLTVAGNAVETLNHKGAASGYVPLGADTKIPNAYLPDLAITNTFVVTSEAEMLALTAQTGDVCVRLDTTENYILAAEPATVLANWTKLAASTTAGNTTIVKREEFAPAAAATSVALAAVPTQMLSVSRNGVEQSQPAGHYTVAGVTVTFTDAFVAGERVSVVYEVGSSAPAPINGYTKVESDQRYVDVAGDTMTGNLTINSPSGNGSVYLNGASEALRGVGFQTNTVSRWDIGSYGANTGSNAGDDFYFARRNDAGADIQPYALVLTRATGAAAFGGAVSAASMSIGGSPVLTQTTGDARYLQPSVAATTYLPLAGGTLTGLLTTQALTPDATNSRDLGALAMRFKSAYLGTVLSIAGASATANQITHAITTDAQPRLIVDGNGKMRWGPGASTAQDTNLQRVGVGVLRADDHLGVGVTPAAWGTLNGTKALQVADVASLYGDQGTTYLGHNTYVDSSGASRAITAAYAMRMAFTSYWTVQQVGNVGVGGSQSFATRLSMDPNGTVALTPAAAQNALVANGKTVVQLPNAAYLDVMATDNLATAWAGFRTGRGNSIYWSIGHNISSSNADNLDIYCNALGANIASFARANGTLSLTPVGAGVAGLVVYGQSNFGSAPFAGYGCINVNVPVGMASLLTGYVRYGIDIAPSVQVGASATGVTVASINAGLLGSSGAGSVMDNAYAAILSGPTLTNGGTISNAAALYVTNPTTGGAVAQNRAIIHGNTGASLTTAGAWTNAPSWLEGKSDVRYVEGKDVALFADWFTMGWKPARYRYPALTGAEQKLGTEGKPVLRPVTNESEYDHFFTILDEVPQEVREVICVDDTGAISTKDMDGFLAALLQHALQRIVALEAKVNG